MNLYHLIYESTAGQPARREPRTVVGRILRVVWREGLTLMQLNLLFLCACLPVLTIGPALGALAAVMGRLVRDEPVLLWRDYWGGVPQNVPALLLVGADCRGRRGRIRRCCGCGDSLVAGKCLAICLGVWGMRSVADPVRRGSLSLCASGRRGKRGLAQSLVAFALFSTACLAVCAGRYSHPVGGDSFGAVFCAGGLAVSLFRGGAFGALRAGEGFAEG